MIVTGTRNFDIIVHQPGSYAVSWVFGVITTEMTDVQIQREKTNPATLPSAAAAPARQLFDLPALITTFCSWYKQVLAEKNLQLRTKIGEAMPRFFFGNPLLTRHLFFATARNSLLYLSSGEVFLEIEPKQLAGHRYAIYVTITSRGKGMPPARERELFQPCQPSLRLKKQSARSGFRSRSANLYYASMIATILGGGIRVENRFGSGTRYRVNVQLLSSPV